jgi:peptide/nickel transport system permease protein
MWDPREVPIFGTPEYGQFFAQNPGSALLDLAEHLVLPVITLVVVNIAADSRFVRAAMIDALSQDYIRTARAKGLPERRVITRHAFRNALLPVVTNVSLELPLLFTGAVATETIFSWPGMGRAYIEAVANFDYTVLMGILTITAVFVVAANLVADIVYAIVDPRVSYG